MLYDDLIMGTAGAGERKFPGWFAGAGVCWHGPQPGVAAGTVQAYQPVSIRMTSYDYGLRYLKLIMCQLSGSTLSARCRPTGR
jgi:hypothetical protein